MKLDQTCKKIRRRRKYNYNLNAMLSDLIYTRILEPHSSRSFYAIARKFLEPPTYDQQDIYLTFKLLAEESNFIQQEVYKNRHIINEKNNRFVYYMCNEYFFQKNQNLLVLKKGGECENESDVVYQMRLFMDEEGVPLTFSLSQKGREMETPDNPLEEKIFLEYGCDRILCLDDMDIKSVENVVGDTMPAVTLDDRKSDYASNATSCDNNANYSFNLTSSDKKTNCAFNVTSNDKNSDYALDTASFDINFHDATENNLIKKKTDKVDIFFRQWGKNIFLVKLRLGAKIVSGHIS